MAKPSLFDHPKFKRLVYLLRMPEPHVYGHLEYVWRVAYASGNPVIGDEVDVELAAQWQGEAGLFAKTLEEVRLLDRQKKTGKLQVHDLHDHAPDYVRSRFRMERYRKRQSREQLRNGYASPAPVTDQTRTEQTGGNTLSAKPKIEREPTPIEEIPESLKTPDCERMLSEWLAYRSERGLPFSPISWKHQLLALAEMGPERAVECIQYSIKNTYQSICEPKTNGKPAGETFKQRADRIRSKSK